jgi:Family of unknown function (DUF5819)
MIPNSKREQPFLVLGFALFFFVWILFHFSSTLLYNFIEPPSRPAFITAYVEPLFTQNFKVFAPDAPVQTNQLYIKYYSTEGGWSNWENPDRTNFSSFQINRLSSKRSLHLIYREAIHQLQYADAAVNYYVEKKQIRSDSIPAFRKEYLNKENHLNGVKNLLNYYIESANKNKPIEKVKCCIVSCKIALLADRKTGMQHKADYSFFEFELRPQITQPIH